MEYATYLHHTNAIVFTIICLMIYSYVLTFVESDLPVLTYFPMLSTLPPCKQDSLYNYYRLTPLNRGLVGPGVKQFRGQ